jgi:hypothetical protein
MIDRSTLIGAAMMLALCGCSWFGESDERSRADREYDASLQRWIGRTDSELVREWGVPTHSQTLSLGGQALQYDKQDGDAIVCTTVFTTNSIGLINNWTWRGKRCRAPSANSIS